MPHDYVRRPLGLHLRETLAKGGGYRFVEFREEMAVAVERHADRAVAQSALIASGLRAVEMAKATLVWAEGRGIDSSPRRRVPA